MKDCYLTSTGSYLPGDAVPNECIPKFLGVVDGEDEVSQKVLRMNGITARHYAQDEQQQATESVYTMGHKAVQDCLQGAPQSGCVSYLAAGTTYAPLAAPGIGSILHGILASTEEIRRMLVGPLEISSHSGICSSAAAGLVAAIRSIRSGEHRSAVAVGTEHSSEKLKSSVIRPIDDRRPGVDLRKTQWFMSVFLRFMLSDGAGAFLLEDEPREKGVSLKVNWTHSRSFANEAPLCMQLENRSELLSQDVEVLSRYLMPLAKRFVEEAFQMHDDPLGNYRWVLPHLSSFFFRRRMERILDELAGDSAGQVSYWTNLALAGNTGAASIFVMLDQFLKDPLLGGTLRNGDRMVLFIPESGQFNFVLVSLTAVVQ